MKNFTCAVTGTTFEGRQAVIRRCLPDQPIRVVHDKDNAYDENAMAVYVSDGAQAGFLPAAVAARVMSEYGPDVELVGTISEVLMDPRSWGLRIHVEGPVGTLLPQTRKSKEVIADLGEWAL